MRLGPGGIRAVTISLISLFAATICFGLLGATGAFENETLKLGGSFVGFIVTLYSLNRIWKVDGLDEDAKRTASPAVITEVLKLLDFRDSPSDAPGARCKLSDYYEVKKTATHEKLRFHYATTGRIKFLGSPTHPGSADWSKSAHVHSGANDENFPEQYNLHIDLSSVAPGERVPVINQIEYLDAFTGSDGDAFETHLDYPTGRLTMILLMPPGMRCTQAVGVRQIGLGEHVPLSDSKPIVVGDGSAAYWTVCDPIQGAKYAIKWQWRADIYKTPHMTAEP